MSIYLASTSDKLQVITSAAGEVDVHASYLDLTVASGAIGGSRQNTLIPTATTTDVIAAPASGVIRNVKTVKIGNNSATVSNTVSLQHTDGTNVIVIEQVTLGPLERLSYEEGIGIRYFDALGREKTAPLSGPWGNANSANLAANAADTYLTGSQLMIAGRVQPGSCFRWRFRGSKTAAGVAAATFNIRLGTAGTTADTSRCLHTGAAQTAVTDTGVFSLDATFFAIGASAQLQSILDMQHTVADGTGLGTFHTQTLSAAFDVTPAGTIIGVSCNPGASGVWTFQLISVEAINLLS